MPMPVGAKGPLERLRASHEAMNELKVDDDTSTQKRDATPKPHPGKLGLDLQ